MRISPCRTHTWIFHFLIGHFDDGDGQVADEERQEYRQDHLGDPPFVPASLQLPVILRFGQRGRTADSGDGWRRSHLLSSLCVFPHAIFRTVKNTYLRIYFNVSLMASGAVYCRFVKVWMSARESALRNRKPGQDWI